MLLKDLFLPLWETINKVSQFYSTTSLTFTPPFRILLWKKERERKRDKPKDVYKEYFSRG
jgi:hypothetical protein